MGLVRELQRNFSFFMLVLRLITLFLAGWYFNFQLPIFIIWNSPEPYSWKNLLKNGLISKAPSLIKIDVDGIEHLILRGAKNTLENDSLKSIFIEVNDDFEEQSVGVKRLLESAGFTLKEKRQSDMIKGSPKFGSIYNQYQNK
mgnify:CR=1 FL=1